MFMTDERGGGREGLRETERASNNRQAQTHNQTDTDSRRDKQTEKGAMQHKNETDSSFLSQRRKTHPT